MKNKYKVLRSVIFEFKKLQIKIVKDKIILFNFRNDWFNNKNKKLALTYWDFGLFKPISYVK